MGEGSDSPGTGSSVLACISQADANRSTTATGPEVKSKAAEPQVWKAQALRSGSPTGATHRSVRGLLVYLGA